MTAGLGADRTMPQMTKAQKSYLTGVALGFMMSTTLWMGALYYFKFLP